MLTSLMHGEMVTICLDTNWIQGPSSEGATVDLKVLICARCAKVMSNGEPVSDSDITQVTLMSSLHHAFTIVWFN